MPTGTSVGNRRTEWFDAMMAAVIIGEHSREGGKHGKRLKGQAPGTQRVSGAFMYQHTVRQRGSGSSAACIHAISKSARMVFATSAFSMMTEWSFPVNVASATWSP